MWVSHAIWIVQDDGLEIEIGDTWNTRLEASLSEAVAVDPSISPSLTLVGEPLGVIGPQYEVVARVAKDEIVGTRLSAGTLEMAPTSSSMWPDGTTLSFRSELHAQPSLSSEPSDPLIRRWEVRQIYVRQWNAVADDDPNSFRRDLSTVRYQPIQRMKMWDDERPFDGEGRSISDYVLEVV